MTTGFSLRIFARLPRTVMFSGLLIALAAGCKVAPEPIDYGTDACQFCRMAIVDQQHGAEIVTDKGKVFKFDAVECMMNHLREVEAQSVSLLLVNTYSRPRELLDATQASYLVSKGIPSPMGEYLTAFENEAQAVEAQIKHGGDVYTWQEINNRFKD
ncbi:nitrous oxide reductase accessory protein NosL [Robiginitalea biformata]|uniref:nitrous oxide reductase accessory protein NosL n=1 Tax=Robiginitalea biformata TaxID=252307 RepID=UPI003B5C92C7